MTFVMSLKSPFDFEQAARMHSRFKNSLPDLYLDGRYVRVLHIDNRPILISVSSQGTTTKPRLLVRTHPPVEKRSDIESLKQLLRSMFEPSFDLRKFYAVARNDPFMKTVVEKLKGLSPIRPPTLFESIVIAITEQQISLNAAIAIRSRLIESYGDRVVQDGVVFHAFPTPESLAKARLRQMRRVGLSGVKARYIVDLSKKVTKGEIDLETLREMSDEQAVAELTKLRGIGRWTAEYTLIRGMGRVNSLPADDLGIRRAVSRAYFRGRRVSAENARAFLTSKFAPYAGIAAFYLMYHLFWEQPV